MSVTVIFGSFEWDKEKESENIHKHKIDFYAASLVFLDPYRVISIDEKHCDTEKRFYCVGRVGKKIATVRFTRRGKRIRIIGAGFWRAGRKIYEKKT